MMMLIVYIFVILISNILYAYEMAKGQDNFGPYDIRWTQYNTCSGSKPRNSTNITLTLAKVNENYFADFVIDVLNKTSINEIKVWVYKVNNNRKNLLWVYKIANPCKHLIFGDIIKKELKSNNCYIEKSSNNVTVNFTETTKKMIGASFFYGNYSMKAIATSNNANFLCLILNFEFYKKNV